LSLFRVRKPKNDLRKLEATKEWTGNKEWTPRKTQDETTRDAYFTSTTNNGNHSDSKAR